MAPLFLYTIYLKLQSYGDPAVKSEPSIWSLLQICQFVSLIKIQGESRL